MATKKSGHTCWLESRTSTGNGKAGNLLVSEFLRTTRVFRLSWRKDSTVRWSLIRKSKSEREKKYVLKSKIYSWPAMQRKGLRVVWDHGVEGRKNRLLLFSRKWYTTKIGHRGIPAGQTQCQTQFTAWQQLRNLIESWQRNSKFYRTQLSATAHFA